VAAGVPALQDIGLIRVEDAASIVATVLRHGPRRHLQIPLDGATAATHLRGDGRCAPALAMQGPRLVIARLPAGGRLGTAGLPRGGGLATATVPSGRGTGC